jgi:hypothetical protein
MLRTYGGLFLFRPFSYPFGDSELLKFIGNVSYQEACFAILISHRQRFCLLV